MKQYVLVGFIIWIISLSVVVFYFGGDSDLTMLHSDILTRHDERLRSLEDLPSRLKGTDNSIKSMRTDVEEMINDAKLESASRIYNLEVTICLFDERLNEVRKRSVIMNNIVAINPYITLSEPVVYVGLGGQYVEIPTIMDSDGEYACSLKILSIK